ncbi:hypothetical protein Ae263Ps1_3668 [Pseudonocardia sp. Ae263_Ps1]|nr:hypothetical protein Ae150APs1_1650c [Pseudonocardia sp. Ae150A_Ps1]OLL86613.1 hypothetical protein Ae263Ps1_3668 [Pseudonocardia sp. Ae263_Ps1]OLL93340.1 hypothetical protein Ae356Ps1_3237c [Pseudonocardia sp. Ae356_Ps1]
MRYRRPGADRSDPDPDGTHAAGGAVEAGPPEIRDSDTRCAAPRNPRELRNEYAQGPCAAASRTRRPGAKELNVRERRARRWYRRALR